MVSWNGPYHLKFLKGVFCFPQILLGPFLNTVYPILLKLLIAHNIVKYCKFEKNKTPYRWKYKPKYTDIWLNS